MKYSPSKLKKVLHTADKAVFTGQFWIMADDCHNPSYGPAYERGDVIARYMGDSPGEVGWEVNLGSVL